MRLDSYINKLGREWRRLGFSPVPVCKIKSRIVGNDFSPDEKIHDASEGGSWKVRDI